MVDFVDISVVARLTALIVGIGMAISTLEYIANIRQCRSEGLFSWDVWRETRFSKRTALKRLTHPIFCFEAVLVVLLARLVLIVFFLGSLPRSGPLNPGLLSALVATQLYLNFRYPVGKDGSDQMSTIVLVMLFIMAWFPNNKVIANACVVFIAFQAVLSYLTAGIAKLISPQWRSGDVIQEVLSTRTYGSKFLALALRDHAFARWTLNYGTIAFESLIFLVFFLPHPYNAWFLLIPLTFHAGCALFMGLNIFLFAFVATFPSILYVSNQIHRIADVMERCL